MAQRSTRRRFLGTLAAAAAAPFVVPASALGQAGRPAPSGRIGLGHIGVGGMGSGHLGGMLGRGDCQVLADGLNDTAIQWHVEHLYANGVRLIFASTNEIPYGIRFEGDRGWVHVDRSRITAEPPSLLAIQFGPSDICLERSSNHSGNFIECVRTRRPPICNVDVGHHTYVVCALSDIAIRLGRKLRWDPQRELFPGDPEATRMLSRPMREPWTL